jgi:hypothetical protein
LLDRRPLVERAVRRCSLRRHQRRHRDPGQRWNLNCFDDDVDVGSPAFCRGSAFARAKDSRRRWISARIQFQPAALPWALFEPILCGCLCSGRLQRGELHRSLHEGHAPAGLESPARNVRRSDRPRVAVPKRSDAKLGDPRKTVQAPILQRARARGGRQGFGRRRCSPRRSRAVGVPVVEASLAP